MSQVSSLLDTYGGFVCLGALILVALTALALHRRSTAPSRPTSPVRSKPFPPAPGLNEDFGGVPTTGSVQEYERDYPGEPVIGSSGFANANPAAFPDETRPADEDEPGVPLSEP